MQLIHGRQNADQYPIKFLDWRKITLTYILTCGHTLMCVQGSGTIVVGIKRNHFARCEITLPAVNFRNTTILWWVVQKGFTWRYSLVQRVWGPLQCLWNSTSQDPYTVNSVSQEKRHHQSIVLRRCNWSKMSPKDFAFLCLFPILKLLVQFLVLTFNNV